MDKDAAALLLLLFVLMLALAGAYLWVSGSSRRAALAERGRGAEDEAAVKRLRQSIDGRLRRSRQGRRLVTWLLSAGAPIAPADFVLLCFTGIVAGTIVLSLLMARPVAFVVAILATITVARMLVERKRNARKSEFISQLPELTRVLSNGTAAGLSMPGAVQLAARELSDPAAAEMKIVVQETRLGVSMDESLERLRDRLPSREVSVLMTTLIIQQRAGGDTVRALSELGTTLEARKDLRREIRTMLSGAVFTSYLVMAMGGGTLVLINMISPGILRELTTSLVGIIALIFSVVLYAVAFVAIKRITKVDL